MCTVLATAPAPVAYEPIELALPVQAKIELNKLGENSVQRITDGLSQASRVAGFIEFQTSLIPSFGKQLVNAFKRDYYGALADGLDPDEVFDFLVDSAYSNAGPIDTPQVRAAALSVVAYLFEICEIFEHE